MLGQVNIILQRQLMKKYVQGYFFSVLVACQIKCFLMLDYRNFQRKGNQAQDINLSENALVSYLLGRPSRDRQWIFWFGVGCKKAIKHEYKILIVKSIFEKKQKYQVGNLFLHVTSKPRELNILTKCLILQGPLRQVRFVWQYLQNGSNVLHKIKIYYWLHFMIFVRRMHVYDNLNSWKQLKFER